MKTRNVKMAAIAKFVVFNSILPLFDMGTDIRSFVFYLSTVAYHPNWAALTLMWILVPFVLHLFKFLYHLAKTGEADWKDLLLHIPFVLPIRNLYYAKLLFGMSFGIEEGSFWVETLGMRAFSSRDWAEVEKIQKQVAKDGLSESYFESGPQAHISYLSHFFAFKFPDLKML